MGRANPFHRRLEAYDASMDLDEHMARSNTRARRGRRIARQLFALAVALLGILAYVFMNQPNTIGGMYVEPGLAEWIWPALSILGILVGLAWMVRILRAHREREIV
jgi:hypothetical protein